MLTFSHTDCERARESVSAELDGELPELERERLSAHLRACHDCSAWAAQVEDATRRLRDAVLETPAVAGVEVHRPGRRWTVGPAVAVSSAAALVASLVVAIGPRAGSLSSQPPAPVLSPSLQAAASHPLGGAKLFTGHSVGLDAQLGVAGVLVQARVAAGSSTRTPA